jgi:hypothetical protein
MLRGGYGRGGGNSASGVRTIANVCLFLFFTFFFYQSFQFKVLGISRQEVNQLTVQHVRNEPLPLYPPLPKEPLPLDETNDLGFMTETKQV